MAMERLPPSARGHSLADIANRAGVKSKQAGDALERLEQTGAVTANGTGARTRWALT